MEIVLVGVTVVSLGLATCLAAVAWKLMRDHRRFAAARVDALVALASAEEQAEAAAPGVALVELPVERPAAAFDLNEAPLLLDIDRPAAAIDRPAGAMFGETPAPSRRRVSLALALTGVVLVAAVATTYAVRQSGGTFVSAVLRAASISDTAASTPPLELRSLSHELDETGRFVVSGVVLDPAGGRSLEDVVVVVYLFDEHGESLATGRAAIAATTLRAGDESRFEVRVSTATPVSRYRVGFRLPDGATIAHLDKRPAERVAGVDRSGGER